MKIQLHKISYRTAHTPKKSAAYPLTPSAAPSCIPTVALCVCEFIALWGLLAGLGLVFLYILPAVMS